MSKKNKKKRTDKLERKVYRGSLFSLLDLISKPIIIFILTILVSNWIVPSFQKQQSIREEVLSLTRHTSRYSANIDSLAFVQTNEISSGVQVGQIVQNLNDSSYILNNELKYSESRWNYLYGKEYKDNIKIISDAHRDVVKSSKIVMDILEPTYPLYTQENPYSRINDLTVLVENKTLTEAIAKMQAENKEFQEEVFIFLNEMK